MVVYTVEGRELLISEGLLYDIKDALERSNGFNVDDNFISWNDPDVCIVDKDGLKELDWSDMIEKIDNLLDF